MRKQREAFRTQNKILEEQINSMVQIESQRIKELSHQQSIMQNMRTLLENIQKEKEELKEKVLQYEREFVHAVKHQNQPDNDNTPNKPFHINTANFEMEKALVEFSLERFNYKNQLQQLKICLTQSEEVLEKQQTKIERYEENLNALTLSLSDQKSKTNLLYKHVKKVDKLAEKNKSLLEEQNSMKKENEELRNTIEILEGKLKSGKSKRKSNSLRVQKEKKGRGKTSDESITQQGLQEVFATKKTKSSESNLQYLLKDTELKLQGVIAELALTTRELEYERKKNNNLEKNISIMRLKGKEVTRKRSKKDTKMNARHLYDDTSSEQSISDIEIDSSLTLGNQNKIENDYSMTGDEVNSAQQTRKEPSKTVNTTPAKNINELKSTGKLCVSKIVTTSIIGEAENQSISTNPDNASFEIMSEHINRQVPHLVSSLISLPEENLLM